jgi:monoterpene epsilon-lactone hydrolase
MNASISTITHALSAADGEALEKVRTDASAARAAQAAGLPPTLEQMRAGYDAMVGRTPPAAGVTYEAATIGGIPGLWCRPKDARTGPVLLYLHGGAYALGSSAGYHNFVGQLASRCAMPAFIVDYRRAPEEPFPAAVDDSVAAFNGLIAHGYRSIAVVGDSAGAGLVLATIDSTRSAPVRPCAAVLYSIWSDLALSGESFHARGARDPQLTQAILSNAAAGYLHGHSDHDPLASPLYADPAGYPPLQLHVGTDELLFDDTIRLGVKAQGAGVDATIHVWEGMIHGFTRFVGTFEAAPMALDISAAFLVDLL